MTAQAQIIGNAFRLGDMTPGWESAIGRAMLAAVRRERKRDPHQGYVVPRITGAAREMVRAHILTALASGPLFAADMRCDGVSQAALGQTLGMMRKAGEIVGEYPCGYNAAALWRLP